MVDTHRTTSAYLCLNMPFSCRGSRLAIQSALPLMPCGCFWSLPCVWCFAAEGMGPPCPQLTWNLTVPLKGTWKSHPLSGSIMPIGERVFDAKRLQVPRVDCQTPEGFQRALGYVARRAGRLSLPHSADGSPSSSICLSCFFGFKGNLSLLDIFLFFPGGLSK